jgi:hypothetical protein
MVFAKWPSRLAAFGFSGELIRSLRTGDFRIARRRALTLVLKIDAMISSTDLPKRADVESAARRAGSTIPFGASGQCHNRGRVWLDVPPSPGLQLTTRLFASRGLNEPKW